MAELHASLTAEIAKGRMPVSATMATTLTARDYQRLGAHADLAGRPANKLRPYNSHARPTAFVP